MYTFIGLERNKFRENWKNSETQFLTTSPSSSLHTPRSTFVRSIQRKRIWKKVWETTRADLAGIQGGNMSFSAIIRGFHSLSEFLPLFWPWMSSSWWWHHPWGRVRRCASRLAEKYHLLNHWQLLVHLKITKGGFNRNLSLSSRIIYPPTKCLKPFANIHRIECSKARNQGNNLNQRELSKKERQTYRTIVRLLTYFYWLFLVTWISAK